MQCVYLITHTAAFLRSNRPYVAGPSDLLSARASNATCNACIRVYVYLITHTVHLGIGCRLPGCDCMCACCGGLDRRQQGKYACGMLSNKGLLQVGIHMQPCIQSTESVKRIRKRGQGGMCSMFGGWRRGNRDN